MSGTEKKLSMFSGFFIPMLLIFFFISLSIYLIKDFRDSYILSISDRETLEFAKSASRWAGIGVFVLLLIAARFFSVRNICFAAFLSFPIFMGLWILGILPEKAQWSLIIYTIATTLWMGGGFFFFWAFANNHFSFKQAGFYYPYFLILSLLILYPVNPALHSLLEHHFNIHVILFCLAVLIFALYTFTDYLLPRIRHTLDKRSDQINRLFGLTYRYIIGFLTLSLAFLLAASENWLQVEAHLKFPQPGQNEILKESLNHAVDLFSFIGIAFLIVLSFLLYDQKGKGWRAAAYISTGIITLCTLIWYALNFLHLDLNILFNASKAHHIVLAVLAPIILILKEMSFIAVPKEIRFITKTWVDLFFWAAGFFGAEWIIYLFKPGLKMFLISLPMLAILLLSAHLAGKRLQKFAPPI